MRALLATPTNSNQENKTSTIIPREIPLEDLLTNLKFGRCNVLLYFILLQATGWNSQFYVSIEL